MAKIICGHCGDPHTSVREVRECAYWEAEAKAEAWAEGAWLRHAEGWYRFDDDPHERSAWAWEDERRRENRAYEQAVAPPGTIFD